jgi:hypothetical protein
MGWWCGGVKVFCLFLMVFPAKPISSISPRFYFRNHTFCFLPLVTILEYLLARTFINITIYPQYNNNLNKKKIKLGLTILHTKIKIACSLSYAKSMPMDGIGEHHSE